MHRRRVERDDGAQDGQRLAALAEPLRIRAEQGHELRASGMAGEENLGPIAAMLHDVVMHPRHRPRHVLNEHGMLYRRGEAVVHADKHKPLAAEEIRKMALLRFVARLPVAAMHIDDDRKAQFPVRSEPPAPTCSTFGLPCPPRQAGSIS